MVICMENCIVKVKILKRMSVYMVYYTYVTVRDCITIIIVF